MAATLKDVTGSDDTQPIDRPEILPDFWRPAYCIQGLVFDAVTPGQAVQTLVTSASTRRRCSIATPNANFLRLARSDPEFRDAALSNDLAVIDGMPLVWLARMLGIPAARRVCGSDLFDELMSRRSGRIRAFFFGATEEIGRRVHARINQQRCGVRCAGVLSPGFGPVETMSARHVLDAINRACPDLLVVAIGARKGLLWLDRNEQRLSVPVICNLGATINFVAGTVKRAPASFRTCGFEWLWRIKEEPALWRRYALDFANLVAVFAGRVVPWLAASALFRCAAPGPSSALLHHRHEPGASVLTLAGPWTSGELAPLRAAFTTAAREAHDLVIDLRQVTLLDAAFLGLLLVAYGYQRRIGRGFRIRASNPRVRFMMRCHGCGFLLTAGRPAPWPVASTAKLRDAS